MPANSTNSRHIYISPVISDNNTQRLNYITGRSLSEQEFDLMQLYVDERCEDLLLTRQPGIVYGLEVIAPVTEAEFADNPIRINPGLGVSWSGKAVTNRLPLNFRWKDLLDNYLAERALTGKIRNGFYFLTLRRRVAILDEVRKTDPCTRTETDPLRDTRLETLAQVNLQFIPVALSLFNTSRQRVAVRILKKMLNPKHFAQNPDEIKLALVKIIDDKPQWIDTTAGRFLAREDAAYLTLMDYWHSIVAAPNRFRLDGPAAEPDDKKTLSELLGVDYLPAAGKFPDSLVEHLAGSVNQNNFKLWDRPLLKFDPDGLQIEILPVPANAVNGVIRQELTRGVVDLVNGEMDRIRLMVAVNPDDYHPQLMDLPEIDLKLIQVDLVNTQGAAYNTYKAWAEVYWELYYNLEARVDIDTVTKKPTLKTRDIFSAIYLSHVPADAFPALKSDSDSRKLLAIPDISAEPNTAGQLLDKLQQLRREEIRQATGKNVADKDLPRPWSLRSDVVLTEAGREAIKKPAEGGLLYRRIDTRQDIEDIETFIVRTNQLIDEVRDYLSSQRQQLDSITVSFSSLAGGIPGDGTGLKLMRWSDKLTFTTTTALAKQEG